MAQYDIDVTVSNEPPTFWATADIGPLGIATSRNANGDWEGKAKAVQLTLPVQFNVSARGLPNRPVNVEITLTPADGSPMIDYKKAGQLDNQGRYSLNDTLQVAAKQAP